MNAKKILAGAGIAGALSFGALGLGAGLGHADNDYPYPPPVPGHDWHGDRDWHNWGANWRDDQGRWHGRDDFRPPYDLGFVPEWAPPMPPVPDWAPGAQVVWNPGFPGWGVWWGGNFVPL